MYHYLKSKGLTLENGHYCCPYASSGNRGKYPKGFGFRNFCVLMGGCIARLKRPTKGSIISSYLAVKSQLANILGRDQQGVLWTRYRGEPAASGYLKSLSITSLPSLALLLSLQTNAATTFTSKVLQRSDDVEETISTGAVNLSSTDLELVDLSGDPALRQIVGLRFGNVGVAASHTITSAYIQFTVDEANSGATNLTIRGELNPNPLNFTTTLTGDVSNTTMRPRTTASVAWSPPPWVAAGDRGVAQRSADVTAIVQEIIALGGWKAGNKMAFFITGSGEREAESYEANPVLAAELVITVDETLTMDFGDMPDSYGTLLGSDGARHIYSDSFSAGGIAGANGLSDLRIGISNTVESNALAATITADADADDGFVRDELNFTAELSSKLSLPVENETDVAANVYAWMDWEGDNVIDVFLSVPVPAGTEQTTLLNFGQVPNSSTQGNLRLRITSDTLTQADIDGLASDGEVEDYRVTVASRLLTCAVSDREILLDWSAVWDSAWNGTPTIPRTATVNGITYTFSFAVTGDSEWVSDGSNPGVEVGGGSDGLFKLEVNAGANLFTTPSFTELIIGISPPQENLLIQVRDVDIGQGNLIADISGDWQDNIQLTGFSGATQILPQTRSTGTLYTEGNTVRANNYDSTSLFGPGEIDTKALFHFGQPVDSVVLRYSFYDGVVNLGKNPSNQVVWVEDILQCPDLDYGDAPSSYGTLIAETGPRHSVNDGLLYLGNSVLSEDDGQPTANADGDGAEEDGVTLQTLGAGQVRATVTGNNDTRLEAMLCGYLDGAADGQVSGTFESNVTYSVVGSSVISAGVDNEEICIQAPSAAAGPTSITYPNGSNADCGITAGNGAFSCTMNFFPNFLTSGLTYARFRLTTDSSFFSTTSPSPIARASDGEVEDYVFLFTPTAVTIGEVALESVLIEGFLSELNIDERDDAFLLELLMNWNPASVAELPDNSRESIISALRNYLDPDSDGQVVVLNWDTLQERGTVGFFVERSIGSTDWVRISGGMLPGIINAPLGGEYRWVDREAISGQTYSYRLIELEATGLTHQYGPFVLKVP